MDPKLEEHGRIPSKVCHLARRYVEYVAHVKYVEYVEYIEYVRYSRCPGLTASSLRVCPVYRCFFFVPPRHPGLPVVRRYTGVVHFFMLAEPLLLLHTPTYAAAHNTTQHAGCCGQQPTLAYTPCHVRQENYANLVTALPPQNSPAAAHAEVACTAFAVILMTTRKSTASANHVFGTVPIECTPACALKALLS